MLIAITETALPERAHALATKLGLPLTKELDAPPLMQLGWWQDPKQPCTTDGSADYKLALFSNMSGPVFIDFIQGKKKTIVVNSAAARGNPWHARYSHNNNRTSSMPPPAWAEMALCLPA